ncbi:MAG: hypothetical protein AB7O88_18105 [Reyranellaceae bacterium]
MFRAAFIMAAALGCLALPAAAGATSSHAAVPRVEVSDAGAAGCRAAPTTRSRLSHVGRIAQKPGIPFNSDVFRRFNLPPLKAKKRKGDAACDT